MSEPTALPIEPRLLFKVAGAFDIKGIGTVIGGLAPSDVQVRVGDTIEVRFAGRVLGRMCVFGFNMMHGSPPPPEGMSRVAIEVGKGWTAAERDDLEVWVVG